MWGNSQGLTVTRNNDVMLPGHWKGTSHSTLAGIFAGGRFSRFSRWRESTPIIDFANNKQTTYRCVCMCPRPHHAYLATVVLSCYKE